MKKEIKPIVPADPIAIFGINLYQKLGNIILRSSVLLDAIYWLYESLAMKGDIPPIELLNEEQKTNYWNIAKQHYSLKQDAVKCSKASYMIALATNED